MSENDDPESTIPWPGFVDILSTVIIVFVFFMMMTSVIIFVLSEQTRKNAVSEAKQQAQQQADKQAPRRPDVSNLIAEKEALLKEIDKLTQLKNVLSESQQQELKREKQRLEIHYKDMGATITQQSTDVLKQMLPFEGRITIQSLIPRGSDFASIREIALNRALNARNILLQNGIPQDRISMKIRAQAETGSENIYGGVVLVFEP
jgi:hypothetical protein